MKEFILCAAILAFAISPVSSQHLPRGLSPEEELLLSSGKYVTPIQFDDHMLISPPLSSPRTMAEWEELQAIVITWTAYPAILREIVRHAQKEVTVIIITTNEAAVRDDLESHDIDSDTAIEFVNVGYNTVWVRDYGGNPVYLNDVDTLVLVDWIYNRPRPLDDVSPNAVAEHLGIPIYSTVSAPLDLVNTGGNFMSDGLGRGFSSNLVLMENGPQNNFGSSNHDESAIDDIMFQFMGIEQYVKMPVLPFDGIHHIDMHMKLLDENTLLVGQYPDSIADGPQIEANLLYVIDKFKVQTGRDYRVVRMSMPPDQFGRYPDANGFYRTYTNALFVNSTILVPTYEEEYDSTALRIWQETMPGYEIVGINCNAIIPAGGAIHCITKEVGVHDPLWISHVQPGYFEEGDQKALTARIKHKTGIDKAWLFYRSKGETDFDSISLDWTDGDNWTTGLPGFTESTILEYYFKASANSGKVGTKPLPAPEAYFELSVEQDITGLVDAAESGVLIDVFPNPASAITCIPVECDRATHGNLVVRNAHGATILNVATGLFPRGRSNYFFDASGLVPGYYVVSMTTGQEHISTPLLVH